MGMMDGDPKTKSEPERYGRGYRWTSGSAAIPGPVSTPVQPIARPFEGYPSPGTRVRTERNTKVVVVTHSDQMQGRV